MNNTFVSFEQFLPPKETENIITQLRNKNIVDKIGVETESNNLKLSFWSELLVAVNKTDIDLFKSISPLKENWLYKSTTINGIGYVFKITQSSATVRIDISGSGSTKEWCNQAFNEFLKHKETIESNFGEKLIWSNQENTKGATISAEDYSFNLKNRDEWNDAIDFLINNMTRLYHSVSELIPQIKENINK